MRYLVLGGGIAGVCCAEELCKLCPHDEIELVSSDKTLKVISVASLAVVADACQQETSSSPQTFVAGCWQRGEVHRQLRGLRK